MNRFFRLAFTSVVPCMILVSALSVETRAESSISFADTNQRLGGNANANDVALADVDRDGDLDAIIAISGGPNKLWLNNGAGIFSDSGGDLGQDAIGVTLADFDGDSDPDIVFLHEGAGSLRIWFNTGVASGTFTAGAAPSVGGDLGSAIASGNLGGNARPDVFLTRNLDRPDEVWFAIDGGTFYNNQTLGSDSGTDIALGDLDGDGDLDAFVANGAADKVWINQGGAQAGTLGHFLSNGQSLGASLTLAAALGDLDGDGDLDALVGESSPQADRIWVNQGGAQSGTAGSFSERPLGASAMPSSGQTRDVGLGDLDEDGDLDAFLARSAGNRIYKNDGAGSFSDAGVNFGTGAAEAVALGDLDGDGDLDVFLTAFGNPAEVWRNQTPLPLPILPEYRITTFAGNGTAGGGGDGGPAIQAQLEAPRHLAADSQGNVYIADYFGERIRKVAPDGTISTLIPSEPNGFGGDGGPVSAALFDGTRAAAVDAAGNIYISDIRNDRIRRVDPNGIVTTFAGGVPGFGGDGGPAILARLSSPIVVAVDAPGNLWFVDFGNYRIRRVDSSGVISTVAGTGTPGFSGDNGPATNAQIDGLDSLALGPAGAVYFTDEVHRRVRRIDSAGRITTVAGTGAEGLGGGGGPAISAQFKAPFGLAVDNGGNIFIGDSARVRRIDTNGVILTVAGGHNGFSGDDGLALQAGMGGLLRGLAFLPDGDLLFCNGNRVRRLSATGNTVPVFRKYASLPPAGSVTDFGTRERGSLEPWAESVIYINNSGTAALTVRSVELLGDTSAFRVTVKDDSFIGVPLPYQVPEGNTGDGLRLSVQCLLPFSTVTTHTATVRIVTDDPESPVINFPLRAAVTDDDNPEYEGTFEETRLFLFRLQGARAASTSASGDDLTLHARALPDQATFLMDAGMPHSVTSQVPFFLGGGSVVISNFTGRVTVSTRPVQNDSNHLALVIESGTFTAPSVLLPSGIATGTNILTFGLPSESDGRINLTSGNYTASASATIVNDLFPNGFPVQGTYSGTFDFALGQASVRSRSTDLFRKSPRLEYLRSLTTFLITWTRPGILEAATNVFGPWTPRSNAVSPYPVDTTQDQLQFFRLLSPAD